MTKYKAERLQACTACRSHPGKESNVTMKVDGQYVELESIMPCPVCNGSKVVDVYALAVRKLQLNRLIFIICTAILGLIVAGGMFFDFVRVSFEHYAIYMLIVALFMYIGHIATTRNHRLIINSVSMNEIRQSTEHQLKHRLESPDTADNEYEDEVISLWRGDENREGFIDKP